MNRAGIAATALVVLAAAGSAGAWFTGTRMETVIQDNIVRANQQLKDQLPDTDLALELLSLQRGIFSSDARYRLVLVADDADEPPLELLISDHIEHGPWPLSRLTSLKLLPVMATSHAQLESSEQLAGLFAASAGRSPLTVTSSIGYANGVDGELQLAPMSWSTDEVTGSFSGLSAVFRTDTAGESIKVHGRVDSLELQGGARVGLAGVDFELDRQRDASGLYLGTGQVELDQLSVVIEGEPAVVLNGLVQSDVSTLKEDGANLELDYRIGSVNYGTTKLGSMHMGWTLSRIDPQAMVDLAGMYNSAALGGVPDDTKALEEQFQASLERLLDGFPRLSLDDFSIRTTNGESRLSLAVELGRPSSLQLPPEALLPELIGSLEARLVLSKPMLMDMVRHKALFQPGTDAATLEQEAQMMAEMVSGMAEMLQIGRVEGDNILTQLSYAGGSLKLNGQAIEPSALAGLLSGMKGLQ